MAGQIKREYEDIIRELFAGNEGALAKLAKVRRTQYDLSLWQRYDVPLSEVPAKSKRYFSQRFLKKARIDQASYRVLSEGFKKLNFAVGIDVPGEPTGCYAKCLRLVEELNEAMARDGLRPVEPKKFIDWLTFDIEVTVDVDGRPITDKPYHAPVCILHGDENRRLFWNELQKIMREKRRMSMQGVLSIVGVKRRESISLKERGP
jgi:hypothetical protein